MKSFGKKSAGARLERMQGSALWANGAFRNQHAVLPGLRSAEPRPSLGDFLWGGERRVPRAPLPHIDPGRVWAKTVDTGLRAPWLGHPAWGDIPLGPENALKALQLLGGGSFLPVHGGTFDLSMAAWDEPPETLLKLAPAQGVHVLMPRVVEAIEPRQVERMQPWWRDVETAPDVRKPTDADETPETISPSVGFPID